MSTMTITLLERIAERSTVDHSTGCYVFNGVRNNGYGQIGLQTHDGLKNLKVHRLAYEILVGPIPPGLLVLHNCPGGDNRACFNPSHLWVGTNDQNMQDGVNKGQFRRGEQHHFAKLDPTKVRQIRVLFTQGISDCEIARRYGVSNVAIGAVRIGKNWKHVA